MKTYTDYIVMNTKKRKMLVHITDKVEEFLKASGLKDGFILVSAMHITAGIIVNDHESGLMEDIMDGLEDNGDAHLKRITVHHQVIVPVTDGRLDLGPWERIFYAEFDGQRNKKIILKGMGI